MQKQKYQHERDAFESLNVSMNTKFNKGVGSKISRDLLKILFTNEIENDRNSEEWKDYKLKLKEVDDLVDQGLVSQEEKEKRGRKIDKSYKKTKNDKIKSCMMDVGNKWSITQYELSNLLRTRCKVDKPFNYAIAENGDLCVFSDCHRFCLKAIKNIADLVNTNSDYKMKTFMKNYPPSGNKCRLRKDLWRINKDEYIGHYDEGKLRTFHRGTMVGFIIHKNNV